MGVLLGISRPMARSPQGQRAYALKPFYRGQRVTVVGAITQNRILALKVLDHSLKADDFRSFIQEDLAPQLWPGAVVVMDNLATHKVQGIESALQAVGAEQLFLSAYSPDFNPIEHLWWQLKAFLRQFTPTTITLVEQLLDVGRLLCSATQLRNYFAHCCYCTS